MADRAQRISQLDNVIHLRQPGGPVVRECHTVGELIHENFVYLLDQGEHDTLRRLMVESACWLMDVLLPPEFDGRDTRG